MAKLFVIICAPRTGSNFLCDLLARNRDCSCHFELFNPETIYRYEGPISDSAIIAQRDADPLSFLDRVFSEETTSIATGFKMFWSHDHKALTHCCQNPETQKIILTRENLLAQFSSLQIAAITQKWAVSDSGKEVAAKPKFEAQAFDDFLQNVARENDLAQDLLQNQNPGDLHHISYHQLFSPWKIHSLLRFLGLRPQAHTQSRLRKQNSSVILDRFSNPEAASQYLNDIGKPDWKFERLPSPAMIKFQEQSLRPLRFAERILSSRSK